MSDSDRARAAVEAYVAGFNGGSSEKAVWLATLADNAELIDPVGTPARRGKAEVGGFFDVVFDLCERVELRGRELYVSGDEAALVFTVTQHRKSGEAVTIQGVDVFRFDEQGKITSVKGYPGEPGRV